MNENVMGGACRMYGRKEMKNNILVKKPQKNRALGESGLK